MHMSGFFAPRAPVSRLVNCTWAGSDFLRAQLGHRMETGSLEAAEKWTEELQSVSLPCLMCLQVPLKTGKASEMEWRRKRESINIQEGVLENGEALLEIVDRWMCVDVCVHTRWVFTNCMLQIFCSVTSERCLYQIKVYLVCKGDVEVRMGVWHWRRNYWVRGSICHQKEIVLFRSAVYFLLSLIIYFLHERKWWRERGAPRRALTLQFPSRF